MKEFKIGDMVVWQPFDSALLNFNSSDGNIFGVIIGIYNSSMVSSKTEIEVLQIFWLTEDKVFQKYFSEIGPNWHEFIKHVEELE